MTSIWINLLCESGVLHGEDLFDAACACGLIIAFSLRERFSNDPKAGRDALAKVINFITERFESSDFENLDDEHTMNLKISNLGI